LITPEEKTYKGIAASKGISIGKPFIYRAELPGLTSFSGGRVSVKKEIGEYQQAVEQSKKELSKIFNLAKEKLNDENLMIFDAQLGFLNDVHFHEKVIERVQSEKRTASSVFSEEIKNVSDTLMSSKDDYMKERVNDIEDIKNRVLRNMAKKKLISRIDENSIVVAHNLTPADTILFSRRNLLGFATDSGGTNSHVAIIARSINIPAVVGMKDISSRVKSGDFLIIDGYKGIVIQNPSNKTVEKYNEQIKKNNRFEKKLKELEKLPTVTIDGREIKLSVNIEFNNEVDYVATHAACGVGLYRTEHMFLEMGDYPSEEEQFNQYKMLSDRILPHVVTIRTFDIGGDKLLPESQKEPNPYLGWRGIRVSLDMEEVFTTQLRAILKASKNGNLRIMFPMITSLDEILKIKLHLNKVKEQLREQDIPFDENIKIGIMVEVPSAVFLADRFASEVDFFSIGTNDLVQYILAVDRDSSMVSNLYRKFHPAVINAIYLTAQSAIRNNIKISVCGEMAADPFATALLIGLGIDELSVETTSFLGIKRLIRLIKYSDAKKIAEKVLKMDTETKISEYLLKTYSEIIG
jgi:phosphotransferase system enzyme I (PtsI)